MKSEAPGGPPDPAARDAAVILNIFSTLPINLATQVTTVAVRLAWHRLLASACPCHSAFSPLRFNTA